MLPLNVKGVRVAFVWLELCMAPRNDANSLARAKKLKKKKLSAHFSPFIQKFQSKLCNRAKA